MASGERKEGRMAEDITVQHLLKYPQQEGDQGPEVGTSKIKMQEHMDVVHIHSMY